MPSKVDAHTTDVPMSLSENYQEPEETKQNEVHNGRGLAQYFPFTLILWYVAKTIPNLQ